MKLIPEQIAYLRRRKKELEERLEEYQKYCSTRESGGMEGIGAPHFLDFQEQSNIANTRKEKEKVERMLQNGEYQSKRNFEMIDIGTGFYVDFGDGESERAVLIDQGTTSGLDSVIFSSTESDFGKSVQGKKAGDKVSYTVQATGRKINLSILDIDKIKEHYVQFIRDKKYSDRVSEPVKKELARLKIEDKEEYDRRHGITPSQKELLIEELSKAETSSRKAYINKMLREAIVLGEPKGDRIQIGSKVDIMLKDGEQEVTTHSFEVINRAVSTELDCDYVERISTLGNSIYGLKAGDTFIVRRNHKPALKGIVTGVTNYNEKF